jgi:hypothetical protein
MTYVDAYEMEGWKNLRVDKIKPHAELKSMRQKIMRAKRLLIQELTDFRALFQNDTPLPQDAAMLGSESDIVCSKCGSTDTAEDNDILICESEECNRYVRKHKDDNISVIIA